MTLLALPHPGLLAGSLPLSWLLTLPLALTLPLTLLLALLALLARVLTRLLAALTLLLASLPGSALTVFAFTFAAAARGFLETPAHVLQAGEGALKSSFFSGSPSLSKPLSFPEFVA